MPESSEPKSPEGTSSRTKKIIGWTIFGLFTLLIACIIIGWTVKTVNSQPQAAQPAKVEQLEKPGNAEAVPTTPTNTKSWRLTPENIVDFQGWPAEVWVTAVVILLVLIALAIWQRTAFWWTLALAILAGLGYALWYYWPAMDSSTQERFRIGGMIAGGVLILILLFWFFGKAKLADLTAGGIKLALVVGAIWLVLSFMPKGCEGDTRNSAQNTKQQEEAIEISAQGWVKVSARDWSYVTVWPEQDKPVLQYIPPNGVAQFDTQGGLMVDSSRVQKIILGVPSTLNMTVDDPALRGPRFFMLDPECGATSSTIRLTK